MAKINKHDRTHYNNLSRYAQQIEAVYLSAVNEAAAIGALVTDFNPDRLFSFSDYPVTRKRIERLLESLRNGLQSVIVNGIQSEWTLANNKNNELCKQVFGKAFGHLTKEQEKRYLSTNETARDAFLQRKTAGLRLSDRVWNYTNQFKEEIELGLDVGIRGGKSADEISQDLRLFLKYPDKLFRRVRDEQGELQLSKNAAAFHPGQGVYRSSYKNARRVAVTECNIAYRTADHLRWQQMDFVVGILIEPSDTNHPVRDICDDLKGRYPKNFKWTGWHPHCRCHATPILKTEEEVAEDNNRIIQGGEVSPDSVNTVTDVPKGFSDWVKDNSTRIIKAQQLPYFMTDNSGYVMNIMQHAQPNTKIADMMMTDHFWRYAPHFKYLSDRFDSLYDRLMSGKPMTDVQKGMLVNQIKQECANLTIQDLRSFGMVGDDWVVSRIEYNTVIHKEVTYIVDGKTVKISETLNDLIVFKDKTGREFAYPIGAEQNLFNAKKASEAISNFPPYLRQGIKRVTFLDIPCPADPYWRAKYKNPNHRSMATDGGRTTFFMTPKDIDDFRGYMAHEAGHILDGGKYRFSSSKAWLEAVAKDDEIFKSLPVRNRVSKYAMTNDCEDFAECMKAYITDHEFFKQCFPNRAAFIRQMAQRMSGHFPKRP